MHITLEKLNALLAAEDIEGYIDFGAPSDEYKSEAEVIWGALNELSSEQFTLDNILAIISLTWMKYFNLGPEEMQLRLPGVQRVAEQILGNNPNN